MPSHQRVKGVGYDDDDLGDYEEDDYGEEGGDGGDGMRAPGCAYGFYQKLTLPSEISPEDQSTHSSEQSFPITSFEGANHVGKGQLRESTTKVRQELGTEFNATDKEIQDALWNYYYDVGKTVTYIKSTLCLFLQSFSGADYLQTSRNLRFLPRRSRSKNRNSTRRQRRRKRRMDQEVVRTFLL